MPAGGQSLSRERSAQGRGAKVAPRPWAGMPVVNRTLMRTQLMG